MDFILNDMHFVVIRISWDKDGNVTETAQRLRSLTEEEAESYFSIIADIYTGTDQKTDDLFQLCNDAFPDIELGDEDTLTIDYIAKTRKE